MRLWPVFNVELMLGFHLSKPHMTSCKPTSRWNWLFFFYLFPQTLLCQIEMFLLVLIDRWRHSLFITPSINHSRCSNPNTHQRFEALSSLFPAAAYKYSNVQYFDNSLYFHSVFLYYLYISAPFQSVDHTLRMAKGVVHLSNSTYLYQTKQVT